MEDLPVAALYAVRNLVAQTFGNQRAVPLVKIFRGEINLSLANR